MVSIKLKTVLILTQTTSCTRPQINEEFTTCPMHSYLYYKRPQEEVCKSASARPEFSTDVFKFVVKYLINLEGVHFSGKLQTKYLQEIKTLRYKAVALP